MRQNRESHKLYLNRVIFQMVLGTLGALFTLLLAFNVYINVKYRDSVNQEHISELETVSATISTNIRVMMANGFNIYASDENFETLRQGSDAIEKYEAAQALSERLYSMMKLSSGMDGFIISYDDGEIVNSFYNRPELKNADILEAKKFLKSYIVNRTNLRECVFTILNGAPVAVGIIKRNQVSVMLIYPLTADLDSVRERDCRFLICDGEILLSEEQAVIHTSLTEKALPGENFFQERGNHYNYFGKRLEGYDVWVVLGYYLDWTSYLTNAQLVLFGLSFSLFLLAIQGGIKVRKQMLLPLLKLVEDLNQIKAGDFHHKLETDSLFTEIQLVNDTIEQTLEELQKQKDITYEQTIETQKAQLQYLSMQLKPHFYLNGLKTLNALAMSGEKERVQDLIMRLSNHVRYILQLEKSMVLLREEIDYVENYAALQRNMTDRPLEIDWDIEEGVMNWKVPTLCIQTFVENSFKYAKVGNPKSPLIIRIGISRLETEDGEFLDVNISDNGSGYPEELLEIINGEPTETSASVGVNNLKRRCRILYGEWAEYSFYNDGGAVSELIYPWKE